MYHGSLLKYPTIHIQCKYSSPPMYTMTPRHFSGMHSHTPSPNMIITFHPCTLWLSVSTTSDPSWNPFYIQKASKFYVLCLWLQALCHPEPSNSIVP